MFHTNKSLGNKSQIILDCEMSNRNYW